MVNTKPKPLYELTEKKFDKVTGGGEGPQAPDQPARER